MGNTLTLNSLKANLDHFKPDLSNYHLAFESKIISQNNPLHFTLRR